MAFFVSRLVHAFSCCMQKMKNLKIVLINPPLTAEEQAGSLKEVANILPPLGIGYIAAVLEKNDFPVKVIDCRPLNMNIQQLIDELKKENPHVIGITATVLEAKRAIDISNILKKEMPRTLLVIGGPHFTSMPTETLKESAFDIGVYGEGEITFLELANAIEEAKVKKMKSLSLKKIKGLHYKDRYGKIFFTGAREYIQDLDSLPFPARHLYPPLNKYHPVPASYIKFPLGHLMSSRGCPYQCIFCDRKIFGNKYRARNPQKVVDEIEELIKVYGAKEIKFFDDTFTMDPQRVIKICDEMERRKIRIPWSCLTRANTVSKELLQRMKKAGCWQVAMGLESGDQRMLNIMKKGVTVEQNELAVKWAKEAGLNVRAFFVIGMPGETIESIEKTIKFAKRLPLDVVTFYALTLYPGNELYEIVKKEGKILHEDFSQYTCIIDVKKTKLTYVPEGLTEEQIREAISRAHKEFYLRPGYLIRQLLSIRSFSDIKRYWQGFKAIIGM